MVVGSMARVERWSFLRLFAVLISIAGVALVSTADLSDESSQNDWRGDLMALASAVFYGTSIAY
jgi:drug/metabolite transporter (DMT)-like permease